MPNGALFFLQLEGFLVTLHDRGVVNEDALLAVLKDLLDNKPLTLLQLAAVFGIERIYEAVREEGFV
jgi:hypothetical protein